MLSLDQGKLTYGTPFHDQLLQRIRERKEMSDRKMKNFHRQWDDADDSMRAYIHEREIDKKRKDKKKYDGEVDYITLEVPYTYAIVMTAHTYYTSVMLSRSPVWQFTGRHGETQESVQAVEAIMDYQLRNGEHLPVLYNWLYDLARYSLGIIGVYWDKEEKVICRYEKVQKTFMGIPFPGETTKKVEEIVPGYEGNKLFNVRPYDFYPDPRVAIWNFQKGEFCIRDTSEGYHDLIATAHTTPGYYINLKALGDNLKERGNDIQQGSSRIELPLQPGEAGNAPGPGFVKITDAYVKLIPSVWGLGDSKRVELWCFHIAEDAVIIRAAPLGLYHNKFPFSVMEGNFGSEEFAKFGMLEIIRPLTDILTWLVNSHFYNVRRVLNNQLVVDPSMVVQKDLLKPGQRIIRLKPAAYGRDVRTAIHQLQHVDVTRSHLQDVAFVEAMIQRVSAVVDNVMGMVNTSGRKTATEVRSANTTATTRLKTPVEYNSALAWFPLSQMLISNTQQLMSMERKFAVAGNTMQTAQKFIEVSPQSIAGNFDMVPVDGALPIDRLAQASLWKEVIAQVGRSPQIAQAWDLNGMLMHTMMLAGERNIDRFKINVLPPGVAPGQGMVPLQGMTGGKQNGGRGIDGRGPGSAATGTSGGVI
jgi:hypothetical protein